MPEADTFANSSRPSLADWSNALHHGRVVDQTFYSQIITPTKLTDNTVSTYGFGLENGVVDGVPVIGHSGGIMGGQTDSLYVPSQDIFVAVLANTDAPVVAPIVTVRRIIALAMKPYSSTVISTPPKR